MLCQLLLRKNPEYSPHVWQTVQRRRVVAEPHLEPGTRISMHGLHAWQSALALALALALRFGRLLALGIPVCISQDIHLFDISHEDTFLLLRPSHRT